MTETKFVTTIGAIIGIPLMIYAVHCNLWAEPDPPKIEPVIVITEGAASTELSLELTVCTIEEGGQGMRGEMKAGELEQFAAAVEAEAGNQSLLGKRLVADVIINRREDPNFPDSIKGVIEEPGQLDVVRSGSIKTVKPSEETWNAVYTELTGERVSNDVLYFRTKHYSQYGEPLCYVGDHYFSGRR